MKRKFLLVIMILIVTLTSCTASNNYTCKINKEIVEINFCESIMKNAKECYDADYGKYATDEMKKVSNHWLSLNRKYDALLGEVLSTKDTVGLMRLDSEIEITK